MSKVISGVYLDGIVEEAVERLGKFQTRDAEFEARFGKWTRPEFAKRYPLEAWVNKFIHFSPVEEGIIDVKPFLLRMAPEDRRIAGEIARFVSEEVEGKWATDSTLKMFRLSFARRLDACGF